MPLFKYAVVPNVGHNEKGMPLSSRAAEAIFAAGTMAH
jgi:hypothetical protein